MKERNGYNYLKNKKLGNLDHFLAFVKDLDFVEVLSDNAEKKISKGKESKDDFFSLAGIWENRDIDAEQLRAKAWPKKN